MDVKRGEIWWIDLPGPAGSGPGYRRPGVVVSDDAFNRSRIGTVIVMTLTTNLALADAPGNARLNRRESGLPKPSVANASQLVTVDKRLLTERVKRLPDTVMTRIDDGLRKTLSLRG